MRQILTEKSIEELAESLKSLPGKENDKARADVLALAMLAYSKGFNFDYKGFNEDAKRTADSIREATQSAMKYIEKRLNEEV